MSEFPSEPLITNQVDAITSFADDVRRGLTAAPKSLPPKYFYDNLGSHLFEAICCLPEYYVTRAESEILTKYANDVIAGISGVDRRKIRLVELGSGSADKTRFIIEALFNYHEEFDYIPIDISSESIESSSERLLHAYPRLRINPRTADFFAALESLEDFLTADREHHRNIVLFLGSSIGNFYPEESQRLLRSVRKAIQPGDVLILGADLKKSSSVLIPAYDDALGVMAAFNLNLLVRINRELGADFDLKKFQHKAIYNEELGRVEMHLFSRESQVCHIRALDLEISFQQGESIHTENSYKYDLEQLSAIGRAANFSLDATWFDDSRQFSLNLFTAV